jgi:hypothetical protein
VEAYLHAFLTMAWMDRDCRLHVPVAILAGKKDNCPHCIRYWVDLCIDLMFVEKCKSSYIARNENYAIIQAVTSSLTRLNYVGPKQRSRIDSLFLRPYF